MSAKPEFAVTPMTRATSGAATGGFVINLTSSTTPMALSQPKDPTLAQYTFFVSRRREDGRERFRLHMGYFETQQAAEEMLVVVREVYPSAWAGEAPGKKLRAPGTTAADVAAAAAAETAKPRAATPAPATPAAPPVRAAAPVPVRAPAAPAAPVAPAAPPRAATPVPPPPRVSAPQPPVSVVKHDEEPFVLSDPDFEPMNVPVVHAPPAPAPKPVVPAAKAAPKAPPAKPVAAKPAVPARPAAPAKPPVPAKAAVPARATPAKPPVVAPKIAAQVMAPALRPAQAPASPMPAAAAKAPVKPAVPPTPPAMRVAPPEPTVMMPAPNMAATPSLTNVRQVIEELDDLSDTQTIRLLERHTPFREGSAEANVDEAIRVIKPEDAYSMQAIKAEVKRNAPVLFAVQLDWSVTPFDLAKVPPLAIFNAYTLYTTEASREGRTWYGLRLGFFSDAVSAKQVAYYVRSDFKTVSVVPVTTVEKERANDLNAARSGIHRAAMVQSPPAPTPVSMTSSNASGIFKLLDDDMPAHIEQDVDGETSPRFSKAAPAATPAPASTASAAAVMTAAPPAEGAANMRPKAKTTPKGKGMARREAHARVDEETLDQTLEILGASTLEIQTDTASETGVRHLRVKVDKKGSKFASLIERLSGKK
jgi:hypothetical protein